MCIKENKADCSNNDNNPPPSSCPFSGSTSFNFVKDEPDESTICENDIKLKDDDNSSSESVSEAENVKELELSELEELLDAGIYFDNVQ